MWAKNSTPSPGFLKESLVQNMTPQRVDQGESHRDLGLEFRLSRSLFPPTWIGSGKSVQAS